MLDDKSLQFQKLSRWDSDYLQQSAASIPGSKPKIGKIVFIETGISLLSR